VARHGRRTTISRVGFKSSIEISDKQKFTETSFVHLCNDEGTISFDDLVYIFGRSIKTSSLLADTEAALKFAGLILKKHYTFDEYEDFCNAEYFLCRHSRSVSWELERSESTIWKLSSGVLTTQWRHCKRLTDGLKKLARGLSSLLPCQTSFRNDTKHGSSDNQPSSPVHRIRRSDAADDAWSYRSLNIFQYWHKKRKKAQKTKLLAPKHFVKKMLPELNIGNMTQVEILHCALRESIWDYVTRCTVMEELFGLQLSPDYEMDEIVSKQESLEAWLDPCIALVVIFYCTLLGFHTDYQWKSWMLIECIFFVLFLSEWVLKIAVSGGLRNFFSHPFLWHWYMFDTFVLFLALMDIILTYLDFDTPQGVQMLRLLRLLRIVRIIRLISAFKELSLLLRGFAAGIRTLTWCVIVFATVIYFISIYLTQVFGTIERPLFATLFDSMYTLFRCFVGECETGDGNRLNILISRSLPGYTPLYFLLYAIMYVFVVYGIFTQITSILIETTVLQSKYDDLARSALKAKKQMAIAKDMHLILRDNFRFNDAGQITRKEWDNKSNGRMMRKLLEKLDIPLEYMRDLFDTFDSDGDGVLSIKEVVTGMHKLRGKARSMDTQASRIILKVCGEEMRKLEERFHEFQKAYAVKLAEVEADLSAVPEKCAALILKHDPSIIPTLMQRFMDASSDDMEHHDQPLMSAAPQESVVPSIFWKSSSLEDLESDPWGKDEEKSNEERRQGVADISTFESTHDLGAKCDNTALFGACSNVQERGRDVLTAGCSVDDRKKKGRMLPTVH